ncbi:MAG: sigma-54 dependent transcriptional regulator [Bacteroidales bacterium]|nr:sigma-54 dependent transcriptional regulator [Bacteroidales bacterium]MDD3891962.1 sigma-54 dependent transcriptional regulator [Bacteroidales bacterium]
MARILVVDDDSSFCIMLHTFLTKKGHDVDEAFSVNEALRLFNDGNYDIILADYRLPDGSGLDILTQAKALKPSTGVIIMTGYADIRMAVKMVKLGAFDYVAKPINPDEILLTIQNLLNQKQSGTNAAKNTEAKVLASSTFIQGDSENAKEVKEYISLVAPTNLSVIIQGDSGTGKEYVARKVHEQSKRSANPFVAVDCGALSKDLALSEFFGHIKGSFTGAISDKTGHFEVANGGTIFLDEIGNLTYEMQVNLLRAIQERKIKPIGSNREIKVDVRIIVATNDDLKGAVVQGKFREDLYHRLNEFTIHVAPLSERIKDLPLFANHFLMQANSELAKHIDGFSDEVIEIFNQYVWPGNIRELRNVIRRAVLVEQGKTVGTKSLPPEIIASKHRQQHLSKISGKPENLKDLKEIAEKEMIISTLEKVRYNKSRAALLLNIDRKTLYNKMKQYGIQI